MQASSTPRAVPVGVPALPAVRWRLLREALTGPAEGVALGGLVVLTLASRLVLRPRYLFNWDAVQFALGVQRFDLAAHRPHPPGYIGYIMLGRLATAASGGDPQAGLILLAAVASAAAVAAAWLVARDIWGRFAGWSAALLLASSPLAWLYGATALSYALEPPLTILVLWSSLRAARGRPWFLALGAVATAAAGAIRPTDELFLGLPVAFAAWRCLRLGRVREVIVAGVVGGAASVAWVAPLLAMSGGLSRYLTLSRELGAQASSTSAIWKLGLAGLALNGGAVAAGLALGLGLSMVLLLTHLAVRRLPGLGSVAAPVDRDYVVVAGCLVAPAMAVFLLVHIGQLGYLLLLVPAFALPAGLVARGLARILTGQRAGIAVAAAMVVACVAANVATFALPVDGARATLSDHDASVEATLSTVRGFDPASTVIVTGAEANGSYRLAGYYLPAYAVVALGRDRHNHAGEMFATHLEGATVPEYDLAEFTHAPQPRLAARFHTVIVLDPDAARLIGDFGRLTPLWYGDDQHAWTVTSAAGFSPVAAGSYVYLLADDCPCQGAGTSRSLVPPGNPE